MSEIVTLPHPAHTANRVAMAIRLADTAVANYDVLHEAGSPAEWTPEIWQAIYRIRGEVQPVSEGTVALAIGLLMGMGL